MAIELCSLWCLWHAACVAGADEALASHGPPACTHNSFPLSIALQFAKTGIPSFVAALPPQARSLYYRDAIGNISSSGG